MEKDFDKKWWYDIPNSRLCTKDMEVRDEDDKLIGHNQHGAAVSRDLKAFLESKLRLLATTISEECEKKKVKEEYVNLERADDKSYIEGQEHNKALSDIQDFISKL